MPRIDSLFRFVGNWISNTCKGFVVGATTVVPDTDNNNLVTFSAGPGISVAGNDSTDTITIKAHYAGIHNGINTVTNIPANTFVNFNSAFNVENSDTIGHYYVVGCTAQFAPTTDNNKVQGLRIRQGSNDVAPLKLWRSISGQYIYEQTEAFVYISSETTATFTMQAYSEQTSSLTYQHCYAYPIT